LHEIIIASAALQLAGIGTVNERLDAFRKRLHGPEKEKDRWKFWVGSPVAWLGLVLSVQTAYINFFRVSDDLKVVITNPSIEPRHESDTGASLSVKFTGTFANNGNRPAVVVGSRLKIGNWFNPDRGCDQISYSKVEFQVKPLLVKANEAEFDVFGTKDSKGNDSEQSIEDFIGPALNYSAQNSVLTCLQFDVVTADGFAESHYFPFLEIYSRKDSDGGEYRRIGITNAPMQLLSSSPGSITWLRSALASTWARTLRYFGLARERSAKGTHRDRPFRWPDAAF
jgi:hypothetical protein